MRKRASSRGERGNVIGPAQASQGDVDAGQVTNVASAGAQAYLSLASEVIVRAPMMEVDGHRVARDAGVLIG